MLFAFHQGVSGIFTCVILKKVIIIIFSSFRQFLESFFSYVAQVP